MKTLFSVILVILVAIANAQYTNLVLEGGGMKGLAYAGAIEVLDSLEITPQIERIAGTSSGAMNGLMVALGYTGREIRQLNLNTKFSKYNQVGVPLISGISRLRKTYGYYKTDRLIEDLGKIVQAKGYSQDITFAELHELRLAGKPVKDLFITGANLTDQKIEIFSHETYPQMRVLDAVRISISIPVYFEALFVTPTGQIINKKEADSTTKVMVDGGILDNYPFYVFDSLVTTQDGNNEYYVCNPKTLGIKLETDSSNYDIAPKSIEKQKDFMMAFSLLSSEYLNRRHLGLQQKKQTIFINTHNFNPKIKGVKKSQKLKVMQYGRDGAERYFDLNQNILHP